ncbi:MAG: dihydroneopterin triphosphate diphosphatase [Burkholderiaceae bacterium]
MTRYKIPQSVLVVIHDPQGRVLLLERADRPGFWQSVTGSLDREDEAPSAAAVRELEEETGLIAPPAAWSDWAFSQVYEIFPHWRHRYAPGVTQNTEHVFSVCVPVASPVRLSPREHLRYQWLQWAPAAETCFSWSNAKAIRLLAERQRF